MISGVLKLKKLILNPAPLASILGRLCASFLLILLFCVSCASAPKAGRSWEDGKDELSFLPAGAKAYLWADAVKGRPILDVLSFEGISGSDVSEVLDSTDSLAAAMFPEGAERRFFLSGVGVYPRSKLDFSLTFSKDWKKQKSKAGENFWFSKKDGIALVLGSKFALVSNADPFDFSQTEIPPESFDDFRRELALAGWIPNPSGTVDDFFSSMGIPLQIPAEDFLFGAVRADGSEADAAHPAAAAHPVAAAPWELIFKIRTPSATHARSLLSLFTMARLFIQRGPGVLGEIDEDSFISPQEAAALLFANSPEQDEDYLTLRTGALSENRLALLLAMFSIY